MEEEDDDFYGANGNAPATKQEQVDGDEGDEGDDNQSEQMDEDEEDGEDEEESDSVRNKASSPTSLIRLKLMCSKDIDIITERKDLPPPESSS
jgi:hypothetical protein